MLTSELFEKRSNPDRNKKEPALDALEKYRGRNDIFVSFTADVGVGSNPRRDYNQGNSIQSSGINARGKLKNSSGFKIGINPKNEYNTPTGIYTYPVDYVLDRKLKVPYGHSRPYIMVVRLNTNNLLEIDQASEADEEHVKNVLIYRYEADPDELEMYVEGSKFKTPGSSLWYMTMLVARNIANDRIDRDFEALHKYEFPEKPSPDSSDEALIQWQASVREIYRVRHDDKKRFMDDINVSGKRGAIWNRILRDCGYDCIIDNGSGTIHPNEPTQAVFLKGTTLKLVEVINNSREMNSKQLYFLSSEHNKELAIREIIRGNMRKEVVAKLLFNNFSLLPAVIDHLKKSDVIQILKDNPEMFQKGLPDWVKELYVELPESFNNCLSLNIEKDVIMKRVRAYPSFWRHIEYGFRVEDADPLTQRVVLKHYPRQLTEVDDYSKIDKQALVSALPRLNVSQREYVMKWMDK